MGILRFTSVILACALTARAQVLYGSITGNVTDKAGLAMPSAKVEAVNTGTGISRPSTTDLRGAFVFNDLQPGIYKLTVSAPSFTTAVENNIQLDANTLRRVDVSLELSGVNQSVTVDASAATLQADRVDVNTQISDQEIEDLPMSGARNFQSLLDLVPGVTPPAASHSEAGNPTGALATNVNGASYNNNGTRMDGAVNSYPWLPEIIAYVPPAEVHPGGQRLHRKLRRGAGHGGRQRGQRHHEIRHQRVPWRGLGIQHRQQAQRQELLLSRRPNHPEVHQQPVRRRRWAGRSKRTNSSSSPIGSAS